MTRTTPSDEQPSAFDEVSHAWTRLGRDDPMWAVLTDAEKSGGRWDVDEFLATGVREIDGVLARLDDVGLVIDRARAVDFGCGAGRLAHGLVSAGFADVVGLDISEPMLEAARANVPSRRCRFLRVDATELPDLETHSVDLVYSSRVLQHMPPSLARGYIREFYRVCRPGGAVVFQLPTSPRHTPAGLAVRLVPGPLAVRLRRGMQMHGARERDVRATVASAGGQIVAVDPDDRAGPRWGSRLYLTRNAPGA